MNQKSKPNALLSIVLLFALLGMPLTAEKPLPGNTPDLTERKPVAHVIYSSGGISFSPRVNYKALTLTVSGPGGIVASKRYDTGGTPHFSFGDFPGLSCIDGRYSFELRAVPFEAGEPNRFPLVQSGNFRVLNGAIIGGNGTTEGISRLNDVVQTDDFILNGGLCVGIDCIDGEYFGNDIVKIKDKHLRVYFHDTSGSTFPSGDFRIVINDIESGGADYFSIEDAVNARRLFTLEAGAPVHSLFVDDNGRMGLGTSVPAAMLHAVNGNTPSVRLDQDTSGGLTARAWEIAGNHTHFSVNDVTNSGNQPFRIEANSPANAFYIADNGNIGIGTSSPGFSLSVERVGTGAVIAASRTDGAMAELVASANFGIVGTRTDHPLRLRVNLIRIMELNGSGNYLQMYHGSGEAGGYYDGTWNDASSREVKENIHSLSAADALKTLERLEPVTYNYKTDKDENHVGFIAEDVPALVATKTRKALSTMDFVAVLTKVTQEHAKTVRAQSEKIKQLEKELASLRKKLR